MLCNDVIAQSASQNFNKYWFYRDRLKKRFMVEGSGQGQSIVIPTIERQNFGSLNEKFKFPMEIKLFLMVGI
jgi:hypothetical protein